MVVVGIPGFISEWFFFFFKSETLLTPPEASEGLPCNSGSAVVDLLLLLILSYPCWRPQPRFIW